MDFLQKILLVDDHPENLYSLESVLAEPGREFYTAGSGQEALRLAYLHDFALILLDVQMPEMDGFEVAEILRSSKRTRDVSILFVTAINTDRKYVLKGLQQGAIDYLQKPLDSDILRAKVQTLLRINQQQPALEQKNHELKQLNEEKNYFLSMAAHDIRNPLSNIVALAGFIGDVKQSPLNPEQRNLLELISKTGLNTLSLLHQILDLSRMESLNYHPELRKVQVLDMMVQALSENRIQAEKKQISLGYEIKQPMPEIMVDPAQMNQVFGNLLSNAIKYSHPQTKIDLTAHFNEGEYIFSVCDQGQGIPYDEQDRLFKVFSRTSVKATNGESSTGLGLTIARKIVEAHKGKIWFHSSPGVGSQFCFSIPAISEKKVPESIASRHRLNHHGQPLTDSNA